MYTQKRIIFDHSRLGLENKFFPQKIKPVAHLHHLYFKRLIHSLSNTNSVGETMDNWTAPKYNFMQHTSSVAAKNWHVAFLCPKGTPK